MGDRERRMVRPCVASTAASLPPGVGQGTLHSCLASSLLRLEGQSELVILSGTSMVKVGGRGSSTSSRYVKDGVLVLAGKGAPYPGRPYSVLECVRCNVGALHLGEDGRGSCAVFLCIRNSGLCGGGNCPSSTAARSGGYFLLQLFLFIRCCNIG